MKNVSTNLRDYFEKMGITQEMISVKLGVDKALVNKLINGKKPFGKKTAKAWSDMFGISYSWLLTGEGEMLPKTKPYDIQEEEKEEKHVSEEQYFLNTALLDKIINEKISEYLFKKLDEKDRIIEQLKDKIMDLEEELKTLNKNSKNQAWKTK